MHLNAEELVDLAEGARPESDAPHLAGCAACRTRLAELRAMMASVAAVDVPEPSPLFWDHFSQRVHDAVEADARLTPRVPFWQRLLRARAFQAGVVAFASLVLVVFVTTRTSAPGRPGAFSPRASVDADAQAARPDFFTDSPVENDASLSLVAMLASSVDADAVGDTGLASVGSADHAVTHMNPGELRELHRILQEEMNP